MWAVDLEWHPPPLHSTVHSALSRRKNVVSFQCLDKISETLILTFDHGRGLKVLWAFLELRARAGIPIKTILFKVCNIGKEYQSIGEVFGVDISFVDHF